MNTLYDFIKTHPPLVLPPAPLVGQLDVKAPPAVVGLRCLAAQLPQT